MKIFVVLIFCLIGINSNGVSQNRTKTRYTIINGDTYSMQMFKNWVPPTGVTKKNEPKRFKVLNYEATAFYRCAPNDIRKDQCGSVLQVTEIKGCKSCLEIVREDSCKLSAPDSKIVCRSSSGTHVKYIISLVAKSSIEPGEQEAVPLKIIYWYIQGKHNSYRISISGCKMFDDILPQAKALVYTLKELDDGK